MNQEEQKENLVRDIAAVVEAQTGLQLSLEFIEELLADIQREQLKALVYQAFLAVQKKLVAPDAAPTSENG